jgi:prepilin peptidase CpaA
MACGTDLLSRRVPNWLTIGGVFAAILFSSVTGGLTGFGASVAGGAVGFFAFMPLFLLGGMGAGDVKLLAAVGAWLGPANAAWTALYASVAGGVLAIAIGLYHGYLRTAFSNLWGLLGFWRVAGIRPSSGLTLGTTTTAPRLPYAIAIAAGTLVTLWLR